MKRGRQQRAERQLVLLAVQILLFPVLVFSFPHGYLSKRSFGGPDTCFGHRQRSYRYLASDSEEDIREDSVEFSSLKRRRLLEFTSVAALVGAQPSVASATESNFDCLLDLPPVSNDCVRIYLCRHGQTENNRLRRVQGARVDPPLNKYGEVMAVRLGMALARLDEETCPRIMTHSTLKRAAQTAEIASEQLRKPVRLETLASLGEVDFGPGAEGKKIALVRAEMARNYAAWAAGFVDTRPEGGGDSGREVLYRAASSLNTLARVAIDNGGSVIAISHSTYLRMMLATVLDMPLAQAATIALSNGCINVIDLRRSGATRILGPKSSLVGGAVSQAPSDFELQVPVGNVIRINENRHLNENRRLEGII